jgi:hypothetical protein
MMGWIRALGASAALILFCWTLFARTHDDTSEQMIPGWDDLYYCSGAVSLDGKKRLRFFQNHSLDFHAEDAGKQTSGTWSFDEKLSLYTISLNSEETTYSLIGLKENNICMLIKGDLKAADLHESWFATLPEQEDDRDGGQYDR